MITRWALSIADRWVEGGIIPREKKDIYIYGLDVTLSAGLTTALVVLLGVLLGDIRFAIFYYACFYPLRGFCGGYHAKTHMGCALLQCASFTVAVYGSIWIGERLQTMLIVLLHLVLIIMAAVFAPTEPPNNPIEVSRRSKLKLGGIMTLICAILPCWR